jgi:hypothetical protein
VRAFVRRLIGSEVAGWRVSDVRASAGVRVRLSDGESSATLLLRPAGAPGFYASPRISVALVGQPQGRQRDLIDALTRALPAAERRFRPGELEDLLADAARRLDPVPADGLSERPLRPRHADLRLNLACDQRCFFCNCDGFAPNQIPSAAAAIAAAEAFGRAGVESLTITGGEPTLHHALVDAAAAARRGGVARISVQTNAVGIGNDPALAARLFAAGAQELFVSLHSSDPGVSDRITGAAGTHEVTLRGIDAALAAGLAVITNFVINRANVDEPPTYVRWLRTRFGGRLAGRVFSFMAPVGAALRNLSMIPRIGDALPPLRAALDDCLAAGERVRVAGVCGLPLCVLGGYERLADESDNPAGIPLADDRVKPPACAACVHEPRCSGVWRGYVALHGDAELAPVRR